MKAISIALLLVAMNNTALAADGSQIAFVQSFEVRSPALSGFTRGVLMQGPVARSEWPSDLAESYPQSMIARTELSMQYAGDHAYPAYRRWVRVGNGFTSILLTVLAFIGYSAWRSRKHA